MKLNVLFFLLMSSGLMAQEYGVASYYADNYHGQKTASGELYNRDELTCAHKSHPFGTLLEVTRMDNKKSVRVRVIDRGPFVQGRVVDVSHRAAEILDLVTDGTARVKVEVVSAAQPEPIPSSERRPAAQQAAPREESTSAARDNTQVKAAADKTRSAETREVDATTLRNESLSTAGSNSRAGVSDNDPKFELVTGKNYKTYDLYKVRLERPERKGFGVQVASFNNYDNAHKQIAELQGKFFENILLSIEPSADGRSSIFKIILGPFSSAEAANNYKKDVKEKTGLNGFVVDLSQIGS
jgi:rare lipoprotein A